jgi:hypothetical protein
MSLRDDLVSRMSVEEMFKVINESSESDWQSHPSYYQAIIGRFNVDNMAKLLLQSPIDGQNLTKE